MSLTPLRRLLLGLFVALGLRVGFAAVGLWCDIRCKDVTYSGNRVHDNLTQGILFEISDGARIADIGHDRQPTDSVYPPCYVGYANRSDASREWGIFRFGRSLLITDGGR